MPDIHIATMLFQQTFLLLVPTCNRSRSQDLGHIVKGKHIGLFAFPDYDINQMLQWERLGFFKRVHNVGFPPFDGEIKSRLGPSFRLCLKIECELISFHYYLYFSSISKPNWGPSPIVLGAVQTQRQFLIQRAYGLKRQDRGRVKEMHRVSCPRSHSKSVEDLGIECQFFAWL